MRSDTYWVSRSFPRLPVSGSWVCFPVPPGGQYGFPATSREQAEVGQDVSQAGHQDPARERREAGPRWLSDVSCYRPIPAYRDRVWDERAGRYFDGAPRIGWGRDTGYLMELPCGKCIGCRWDRARAWKLRCEHEAQLWDANVVVSLSYDDAHIPSSLSLEYRDFQLFMKRLRKQLRGIQARADGRRPVRFFMCGEYGTITGRPHFHAILFNLWFSDQAKAGRYYRSEQCEELWGNGMVWIDRVTPAVASYVAGYVSQKKMRWHLEDSVVDVSTGELSDRAPEFVQMSRRPGIGADWYNRNSGDLFPFDRAISEGRAYKVPRYYSDKFFSEGDGLQVEAVKEARYERARKQRDAGESTPERRAVREEYAERKVKAFNPRGG